MITRTIQRLVLITLITLSASVFADEKINWTGPYVGLDAGYSWTRDSNAEIQNNGTPDADYHANNKPSGGLVGINAGYNYLLNDKWLLGLGAEFKTYNANDTLPWGPAVENDTITSSPEQKFSLLAKVGYLINDKTLFYVNGGWANAEFKRNYGDGLVGQNNFKNWQDGWALGLGSEFNFYKNITAKIEYRYTDLGDKTNSRPVGSVSEKQSVYQNEVPAGVAYHF